MSYPATITVTSPGTMDRWRPVGQWILAFPHLIIAGALSYVSGALAVVSWFAIVFTGSLPESLANFQIMILRYNLRAQLYAGFLHADYPPFDFTLSAQDPGDTPVRIDVRPDLEDRNRLTVGLRMIWAIPTVLFTMLVSVVGIVCWFLGLFAVLFTGQWPEGLRSWVMSMNRVSLRLQVYSYLLTDEYPPFEKS